MLRTGLCILRAIINAIGVQFYALHRDGHGSPRTWLNYQTRGNSAALVVSEALGGLIRGAKRTQSN